MEETHACSKMAHIKFSDPYKTCHAKLKLPSNNSSIISNYHKFYYCTVGFVCKVLICANYVRCHGLANFNSTVTFNSVIVLQFCAL